MLDGFNDQQNRGDGMDGQRDVWMTLGLRLGPEALTSPLLSYSSQWGLTSTLASSTKRSSRMFFDSSSV